MTLDGARFRKGRVLSAGDVAALAAAGVATVTVAEPEPGDVGEDDAAARLAKGLGGAGLVVSAPFTGRANLHAEKPGILTLDQAAVARLNAVDEAITLATLPPFARVAARQLVATVKIIPYAVSSDALDRAEAALGAGAMALHPFAARRTRLILTETPAMKDKPRRQGGTLGP